MYSSSRGYTGYSGYEHSSPYINSSLKSEEMDIDTSSSAYDYKRGHQQCSPSGSNSSNHSGHDLQTLTPPATPFTMNDLRTGMMGVHGSALHRTASASPSTRGNASPTSSVYANSSRDYYSRAGDDSTMAAYYSRTDGYSSYMAMAASGREYKHSAKLDESYLNYYPSAYGGLSSCSATPSPSHHSTSAMPLYHGSGASTMSSFASTTAAALDTDVDPKELDQYLPNQPQARRATNSSYPTKSEEMVELQPMPVPMEHPMAESSTVSSSTAVSKYDLSTANDDSMAGNSNGLYYHDTSSFYPYATTWSYANAN